MKDHEIAELVNELREIAVKHHNKQCLRELISKAVNNHVKPFGSSTFQCKHKSYKEVVEPFTNSHRHYKCGDCGMEFDFT